MTPSTPRSPIRKRSRLAATVVALGLATTACGGGPLLEVPSREFEARIIDPGAFQQETRSQPVGLITWNGQDPIVYAEVTAPTTLNALVSDPNVGAASLDSICVFLDGPGQAGDAGGQVDSIGSFGLTLLPSTYEVLVSPECLQGTTPARRVSDVVIDSPTGSETPFDWSLPLRESVEGIVQTSSGDPVEGAAVVLYSSDRPSLALGASVTSASDGSFSLEVEEGVYDIVVSAPADGSVAVPPVLIANQNLPFALPGLRLEVELPVLPTRLVRGSLLQSSGSTVQGRVRLEGWVPPGPSSGPFDGGIFRAEFETAADGSFEINVPRGSYVARSAPRLSDVQSSPVEFAFEVSEADPLVELELTLPDAKLGRIEVIQPSGARVPGAELHLRLDTWPYYALGATTDQSGAWTGLLAAGRWDVEVIPPRNEETREKEFARIQASLDLRETDASTVVALRRADRIDGFAYSVGQLGVGNVQLLLSDPESGNLLDETVSNNSDFPGFFTAVLPR